VKKEEMQSISSIKSDSIESDSSVKEYDFNREQYGALASKKLKELVGRKSENQSPRDGFGDMYKELLDGSRLSLTSESDWRRLLEKKEIKPSKLTDYYSRQVQKFYEKRGQKLMRHINELVVSAYGKGFSSDKKRFTKYYRENIKNHGKHQFLSRASEYKTKSSSSSPEINKYGGSAKMTGTIRASNQETRDNSASADKHSDLRFRRFGKNRIYYKRVVDLLLDYFGQVKEFAYKLNRHCYLFFGLSLDNKNEGWFQFKLMVYNDLMKILFRDHKVAAFLVHLRQSFNKNPFYASRFQSIKRKLEQIEDHLEGFRKFIQSRINSEIDGKQIFQAVTRFKASKKRRKSHRSKMKQINQRNNNFFKNMIKKQITQIDEIMFPKTKAPSFGFDKIKAQLAFCYSNDHDMVFITPDSRQVTHNEILEFETLSSENLEKGDHLSSLTTPWFTFPIDCNDCGQRRSLEHIYKELELKGVEFRKLNFEETTNQFPINRISNQYSFGKADLIQDRLISKNQSPQIESISPNVENLQTCKKKRKRKRRKNKKKTSASVQKTSKKEEQGTLMDKNIKGIFQLQRNISNTSSHFAECSDQTLNSNFLKITKENLRIKGDVDDIIRVTLKNQEVWDENVKNLGNKRRKDERSRKKGRNKKLRMNEDLKALKAYLEWRDELEAKQISNEDTSLLI
jgi:hypothetical protein